MNELLLDYLPLAVFIAVASGIALALLVIPFLVAYKRPDSEKLSAYECGFNAFDDARMTFDVRFYLVAILFIISLISRSASSLGCCVRRGRRARLLVDGGVPWRSDHRLHI
jgi:hypothetical protein